MLLAEDEFLIAMEVTAVLTSAGFDVLGPVSTVAAALDILKAERPGAAVLDVSLRGERVTPVAEVLRAMEVPFVLASAYLLDDLAEEPALASVRNLGKPTPSAELIALMHEYRALAAVAGPRWLPERR